MRDALTQVLATWTERRAPDREVAFTPSTRQMVLALLLAAATAVSIYAGLVVLISRATGKAP